MQILCRMASRRSHAASHSIPSVSAVSRGDTYSSETHCKLRRSAAVGRADSLSPSLGSAKRDRLSSSTSLWKRQSPFGELYLCGGVARTHSCAASQLAVGFHYIGPAPRNPQLKLNLLVVRGCVATARRHSLLCLHSCSFIISPINCNSSTNSTE